VLGQYVWPNPQPIATTYDGEIQTLKTWLTNRLKWIDANIPNTGACFDYPANVKESVIIKYFPNPVHAKLTLHIDSRNNQPLQVNVFDITGKQQTAALYNLITGKNSFEIPTAGLAAGMYLLSYQSGNGETGTIKFIKQ
jgi:hypothetical protein